MYKRQEQGRYLTGILAGKMTEVNKIGYCSSIPFPDPIKQLNGFAAGVASVNPDAQVVTLWSNSFNDPTTDALCANTLIDQGCDLICIDLSSSAVAQVCEERGVKFIGSSVDMREFAPTQQLTSNCWTWGPWMATQVEAVRNGTFKGQWCELDINDGAISLAAFSDAVPQDVIDLIEAQKQKFMDGEEVFVGPLYDLSLIHILAGVGRKTANVIRGNIYNEPSIVVDTHVKRISRKLGLTKEEDPVKIEEDLMKVLPRDHWILWNIHIITLGRTICIARRPKCEECFLKEYCPGRQL